MCYDVEQMERKAEKRSNREFKLHGPSIFSLKNPELPFEKVENQSNDYYKASGFDHPYLLVIASEEPQFIQRFHWGLIPNWVKGIDQAKEMANMCLNARCETIFEKPSYRNIILKKRALLPVEGFYESMKVGKNRYPHFVYLKDLSTFYLGCVYDQWEDPGKNDLVHSFSIVTAPANELLAKIHNTKLRMPLIIGQEDESAWLDQKTSKEDLIRMMKPFDAELMTAHTVDRNLANTPNAADHFEYPELKMFE